MSLLGRIIIICTPSAIIFDVVGGDEHNDAIRDV